MRSLKFLLDADMPRSSAKLIISLGYDIEDVRDTGLRRAKDEEIVKYALKNNRIISHIHNARGIIMTSPPSQLKRKHSMRT